jgi:hypothetical protein
VQVLLTDFDSAMITGGSGKEKQGHGGTEEVSLHCQVIRLLSYNIRMKNVGSL